MAPGCYVTVKESDSLACIDNLQLKVQQQQQQQEPSSSNNQIPLPLTPPPDLVSGLTMSMSSSSSTKTTRKYDLLDTCDTFEILEQTILKQKKLAKLKNTDLRRKILLKRTFDLVCEIMDHENGFNDDDEEDEEEDNSLTTIKGGEQEAKLEEDDDRQVENKTNNSSLTLVQLDDVYLIDKLNLQSAQVPLGSKRRRSTSDDEEEEEDDENDGGDDQHLNMKQFEINELEGTYFFSFNLLNDQQLSCFSNRSGESLDNSELNLYVNNNPNDGNTSLMDVDCQLVKKTSNHLATSRSSSSSSSKNKNKKLKPNA